jgi:hypothetical protein
MLADDATNGGAATSGHGGGKRSLYAVICLRMTFASFSVHKEHYIVRAAYTKNLQKHREKQSRLNYRTINYNDSLLSISSCQPPRQKKDFLAASRRKVVPESLLLSGWNE